jgi:hypothetical protein
VCGEKPTRKAVGSRCRIWGDSEIRHSESDHREKMKALYQKVVSQVLRAQAERGEDIPLEIGIM